MADLVDDLVVRIRQRLGLPMVADLHPEERKTLEWLDQELRTFGQLCIDTAAGEKGPVPDDHQCHDCGVPQGALHEPGCDMERCPVCGGQLITCGCELRHFYPTYQRVGEGQSSFEEWQRQYRELSAAGRAHELAGIPKHVYEHGLPDDQQAEWDRFLEEKGRIPYIVFPNLCARCGVCWPEMFHVEDAEWEKYVPVAMRDKMLCRPCFDWIKERVDRAAAAR
jgi:hypothetical protein